MTSVMKYFPDLRMAGELIQKHLGIWKEQFLQGAQSL